jgi:large subunit ribosomal protein L29
MRSSELREMTPQERVGKLDELIEQYRGLRFGHVMQQVSNPLLLRSMRRDIARLRTIIAEETRKTAVPAAVPATVPEGEEV